MSQERIKTNEERRIIQKLRLIVDGDTLMVNSGTTTLLTVKALRNVKILQL